MMGGRNSGGGRKERNSGGGGGGAQEEVREEGELSRRSGRLRTRRNSLCQEDEFFAHSKQMPGKQIESESELLSCRGGVAEVCSRGQRSGRQGKGGGEERAYSKNMISDGFRYQKWRKN